MKKILKTTTTISMALFLVLLLPLAMSPPVTEGSESNNVSISFYTAKMYAASGDSITNGDLDVHLEVTASGIGNDPDGSGEAVTGATLSFTAAEGVTVEDWERRYYREGSSYIWDLPEMPQEVGHNFNVIITPDSLTFQPDFDADISFYNPLDPFDQDPLQFTASGQLGLMIDTRPVGDMEELQVSIEVPFLPLVEANVHSATGDGDINISGDGRHVDIHIQTPDTTGATTYSQDIVFNVGLVSGVSDAVFKPGVYVIAWQGLAHGEGVIDTSIASTLLEPGDWTWETPDVYSWNWSERTAKAVVFPAVESPPVNQIYASFETGQTINVEGDSVTNETVEGQPIWMNTDLHNWGDQTGDPVGGASPDGGPILSLTTGETIVKLEPEFTEVGPGEYEYGFFPIPQNDGRRGYAETDNTPTFELGFSAERIASQDTFSTEGGTQVLTITVTPEEAMDRLLVNGEVRISDQVNVHIVEVDLNLPEGCQWEGGFDPEWGSFNYEIIDPDYSGTSYEWIITIEIEPIEEISGEIEYTPFIQVRNMNFIGNDRVFGSSLEGVTAYGTWNWEAVGDYLWDWGNKEVKEVNFHGYANLILETNDIATETHFHLHNGGLQLYDGVVVGCQEIQGNLFTFTHPQTPSQAQITSWSYVHETNKKGDGSISGTFTIEVHMDFDFGRIDGTIEISFKADSYAVAHPFGAGEPFHYNFEGNFKIEGGTGFYEGISGSGSIGGTFHDHNWSDNPEPDPLEKWFDFVLIGNAKF